MIKAAKNDEYFPTVNQVVSYILKNPYTLKNVRASLEIPDNVDPRDRIKEFTETILSSAKACHILPKGAVHKGPMIPAGGDWTRRND